MDQYKAKDLARAKLDEWGLRDWRFEYDNAVKRAGLCRHSLKVVSLSVHYVLRNSEPEVLDTILHEIAHALVGPFHGHGAVWMRMCTVVGCKPERCYGEGVDMPKGKWYGQCPSCGQEFYCHKRPKGRRFCLKCGPDVGHVTFLPVGHMLDAVACNPDLAKTILDKVDPPRA